MTLKDSDIISRSPGRFDDYSRAAMALSIAHGRCPRRYRRPRTRSASGSRRSPRPSGAPQGQLYQGASGTTQELRQEPLLATHELEKILGRSKRSILVMAAERGPVLLQRALYHDENDRFYKLAHGE